MAYEIPGFQLSLEAAADLRLKRFYFVKLDSSAKVVLCAAATDKPIGILQNTPNTGEMATVMVNGVSKVVGGADLTKGNVIGTDANGKAAAYAHGTDTTKYLVGEVLFDNSADGGVASVIFNCIGVGRGA